MYMVMVKMSGRSI